MSINQAAIHHNLPYSSLYGRINRLKRGEEEDNAIDDTDAVSNSKYSPDKSSIIIGFRFMRILTYLYNNHFLHR